MRDVSDSPYGFVFQGGEADYRCLNLGMSDLWDKKKFVACVQNGHWVDETEPNESSDVLKERSIPVGESFMWQARRQLPFSDSPHNGYEI